MSEDRSTDLSALDALEVGTLLLLVGEDERPLTGVAGLVDWRLAGRLSRTLVAERFRGARGEKLLAAGLSGLPVPRLLLVGRGPGAPTAESLEAAAEAAGQALADAHLDEVAVGLPQCQEPWRAAEAVRSGLSRGWRGRATVLLPNEV